MGLLWAPLVELRRIRPCSFEECVLGGPQSYELRTKFRGTYRGLYRIWGGPTKGYATNLVQGLIL